MGWLETWRSLLRAGEDRRRLAQGRAFHRSGRVTSLRVLPGRLSGHVQGSRATPYLVEVLIPPLDDAEWEEVLDVVVREIRFGAQLLAGQLPDGLHEELASRGIALLPSPDVVEPRCACGEAHLPCAHLVAMWEAAGETFRDDPFAFLRLRGRGRERVLGDLSMRRRRRSAGPQDGTVAIEELAVGSWDQALDDLGDLFLPRPQPPGTPAGPLLLLGDPPGWPGGPSVADLFTPLIVAAGEEADHLRRGGDDGAGEDDLTG